MHLHKHSHFNYVFLQQRKTPHFSILNVNAYKDCYIFVCPLL